MVMMTMDVSCFLLVEGSADSDDEPQQQLDHHRHGFTKLCRHDHHYGDDHDDLHDDDDDDDVVVIDDAESCSCEDDDDGSSTLELDLHLDRINGGLGCVFKDNHDHCQVAMEEEEEEEEEEERSSNSVNKEEGRKVMVVMSRDAMDRMEDRLFWETCLAVGYPSLY